MTDEIDRRKPTDAPAVYKTPQRPGQPGEQEERRPGPSPLSRNASGPHPSYDPEDPEGTAAIKHGRAPETPEPAGAKRGTLSENFQIMGRDAKAE